MKKHVVMALPLILFSQYSHAHDAGQLMQTFYHGFIHPISGWDHLLMMVAVGLIAAQAGGRQSWALPSIFVVMMGVGMLAAGSGLDFIAMELVIAITVLLAGLYLLSSQKGANALKVLFIGALALPHGWAHGAELQVISQLSTTVGIIVATVLLHAIGFYLGRFFTLQQSINRLMAFLMVVTSGFFILS